MGSDETERKPVCLSSSGLGTLLGVFTSRKASTRWQSEYVKCKGLKYSLYVTMQLPQVTDSAILIILWSG